VIRWTRRRTATTDVMPSCHCNTGYQKAESVEEQLLDIIDREAENSESLEVNY
jgi:hypothetical protein